MVHTHTLVCFFERGGISASFLSFLWQGSHVQDDLLVTLRFHLSFLLAQILMRTDLGDEPDRPRR